MLLFLHILSGVLSAYFLKMFPGHLKSGQVTLPLKRFVMLKWLQFWGDQYEAFRISYGHQYVQHVPISQILDSADLE